MDSLLQQVIQTRPEPECKVLPRWYNRYIFTKNIVDAVFLDDF